MPVLPFFKLNADRRHHIPKQKRKVTNWRDYDESLRRRGSLTVWFSEETVSAWRTKPRMSRLVGNPGIRRRLGQAAARVVRRRWLWEQLVPPMLGVYHEMLQRRPWHA